MALLLLSLLVAAEAVNFTVNFSATKSPINPNIYGVTIFWDSDVDTYTTFVKDVKLPVNRIGGDATTRYNWQVDSSNSGFDWYFMGGNGESTVTQGAYYDNIINQNNALGVATVVTVPMIQMINGKSPWQCSYPKSVYPDQQSYNPYIHPNGDDCGNGVYSNGSNIVDKSPTSHDIYNSPTIQNNWIKHIVGRYGASSKSRIIYQLDNEVSNWAYMHRDVHPQAVTYPEIVNQSILYAPAIKSADSTAWVAAPSEIQFAWYPDWGGDSNVIYYLQQMQQYEQKNGLRILDSFDVHYPDADDNHWPSLTDVDHLRGVVDSTYPGTGISFSEWNLRMGPLGGCLATADQLGTFARNKAAFASFWGLSASDTTGPISYAFRIYRNYDGQGSMFGETYVQSTSSDASQLSVYAAERSSDGALTILVINKTSSNQSASLALSGFTPNGTAHVYQYSSANQGAIVKLADINVSSSGFTTTYAASSLTLLILAK